MGLPLITKAEYKAYANISSTNSDAQLDILIPKVSNLVKQICRRTFLDYVNDSKTEYFEEGTNTYIPLETPILNISSLEQSLDYGNTYTELVPYVDYAYSKANEHLRCIGSDFVLMTNGYRLTYTAGYEVLPEDLKLAVLDLVGYYLKNDMAIHSPKAPGTNSVQIEYVITTNLPAHIKRVLDLYTANYA
jgi:hypothetical protein